MNVVDHCQSAVGCPRGKTPRGPNRRSDPDVLRTHLDAHGCRFAGSVRRAAFDEPTRRGTLREIETGPEQSTRPADIRAGRFIPAVEYIQANRYRMRVMEQMDAAMAGLDLFLGAEGLLTNRLGYPILSVPNGFFEGSPTALHMTGKLFGEPELLLLAHAYQSRTDFHLKHPLLQ